MTAPAATVPAAAGSLHPLRQAVALGIRAVRNIRRQPPVFVPAMVFPLIFTAMNASAFARATSLPRFPEVDSFLAFLLPAVVLQGVMFGSTSAGTEIATDVADGFFDRLVASPVSRVAILVGRMAGGAVLGAIQVLWFVGWLIPFGATMAGGPRSLAVFVVAGMLVAVAIGGFHVAVGLRTGSAEAVQGTFPLVFIALFTSSAFFPRQLMSGWYANLARVNPLTWMIEALRDLATVGFSAGDALVALAVPVGIGAVSLNLAMLALRRRLDGPK